MSSHDGIDGVLVLLGLPVRWGAKALARPWALAAAAGVRGGVALIRV